MGTIIQFKCRGCEAEIGIPPDPVSSAVCPACKLQQEVRIPASLSQWKKVTQCVACGHENLYIQKDFNRQLGLGIVVVGILVSTYFFNHRQAFYAMAALVGTALIDLLIYAMVGSVTVCYSCHAVYRGFDRNPEHEPFDLKKLEKYGGRTPRFGA